MSLCIGLYGQARWVMRHASADTAFLFIVKVLRGIACKSTGGGIIQIISTSKTAHCLTHYSTKDMKQTCLRKVCFKAAVSSFFFNTMLKMSLLPDR